MRMMTLGNIAWMGQGWGVSWVLVNVLVLDLVDGDGAMFIFCRFTKLSC